MTDDELLELWNSKNEKTYRRKSAEPEHHLQVNCVRWFRYQYPHLLLFSIPNGGWRRKSTAGKLKAEGATPGVPDLLLAHPSNGYHGLWIEMKNGKKGVLSDSQKKIIKQLEAEGYKVVIARTFEEFQTHARAYLNKYI